MWIQESDEYDAGTNDRRTLLPVGLKDPRISRHRYLDARLFLASDSYPDVAKSDPSDVARW